MDYKVSDIMTKNPLCYTVPSSISEVIKILIKNNVTGIPIKNNQNKYQGIINLKYNIFRQNGFIVYIISEYGKILR